MRPILTRSILTGAISAALAGCATTPPVTKTAQMCNFDLRPLIVDDPGRSGNPLNTPPRTGRVAIPKPVLVLSGGSQNGAYGAGFLKRWAELSPDGRLPRFWLVTGISTGSILATWAFIGEPQVPAREYDIDHESELLNVYKKPPKNGKLGFGTALTLIRKNSLADLDPLREKLKAVISLETLTKVAEHPGRLIIAAVEVDTGTLYSFNLKDMAQRAVDARNDPLQFKRFRDCYVEAIMASSSVPLAAKPVFIDNRMFIDGGARHGVFVDYLSRRKLNEEDIETYVDLGSHDEAPSVLPDAPKLYIIVNGTQWSSANCGKLDPALCSDKLVPDPIGNREGAHRKWDIGSLAFRSNDILVNQVYRLSAAYVQAKYQHQFPAHLFNQHFHFSRMHRTDLREREKFEYNGRSCMDWHEADKVRLRPLEFYPEYMRCLQAYGANQVEELKWFEPGALSNFTADTE
jgi:predicted acylesterase/phospholipase RssA